MITTAVVWAPLKLGLFVWLLHRLLRRGRLADRRGIGLLTSLSGHVTLRQLLPLGLLAVAATVVHAAMTVVNPSDDVLNDLYTSIVVLQTLAGFVGLTLASRRIA